MPAAEPITPERHRFAVLLPRPLWIGVATALAGTVIPIAAEWLRGRGGVWQKRADQL